MWRDLEDHMHKDFLDCLRDNDSEKLALYLCNMASNNVTHGLSQGTQMTTMLRQRTQTRKRVASLYFDRVLCLAEMMGCLPAEGPEQSQFGQNISHSINEVVNLIESQIRVSILLPQIEGGLFGIKVKDGVLAQRDLFALEAALELRSIAYVTGSSTFGEIGAGIGKAAFWSWKLGLKNYSIFDLPYVAVISAFYLIKALPPNSVLLYGEVGIDAERKIKIQPYWCFKGHEREHVDVVLNQDSFPEMNDAIVLDYFRAMMDAGVKYLLSINQEGMEKLMSFERRQGRVCIWAEQLQGFRRIYRTKVWTRPGYVEEPFQLESYN